LYRENSKSKGLQSQKNKKLAHNRLTGKGVFSYDI